MREDRGRTVWRLVEQHIGHARAMARAHRGFRVPVEDLAAEGVLGLFEAAVRFDTTQGVKFSTYASWWILKKIREAIASQQTIVRVPRVRGGEVRRITAVSLDDPATRDGALRIGDVLEQTAEPYPDTVALIEDARERVLVCIESLPRRHREVVERRYGIGGRAPEPLAAIALDFGLSRERVHQIEREAIVKLRRRMAIRMRSPWPTSESSGSRGPRDDSKEPYEEPEIPARSR